MLLNLSNHPSDKWPENQKTAAAQFGKIFDIPFPNIPPDASSEEVNALAKNYLAKIQALASEGKITIHLMGELTFCFALVKLLKQEGITCIASTTERISVAAEDGTKTSQFRFVQFRSY